jgi:methyl-accepting chemotaxis protein
MSLNDISLRKKFTFATIGVVIISIALTAGACLWQLRTDLLGQVDATLNARLNVFWEMLLAKDSNISGATSDIQERIKLSNFRIEEGKLIIGFFALNDIHIITDQIKNIFGGVATVYMKDQPVATSLLNKDGTRSLETKLTGAASDAVLKSGKSYKGKIALNGLQYFSVFDPIKNQQGEIIGALLVAVPENNYFAGFNRIMLILVGIAIALIAGVTLFIFSFIKKVMNPLVNMVDTANKLADGDLTFSVTVDRHDEIGQLLGALSNMVDKWRHVVNDVKSASDNIASAGHQLSASAEQMSRGSSEQAGRASQVATATEEMSQTVVDIARNASSIASSSAETLKLAREGETIVHKSVHEVKEIAQTVDESATFVRSLGERSKHIGEIVNVINDIADQTNLLALNAAIEAARAGEQGRGFAVVADEVRKLAERTAQATSEISDMIKAIKDEVFRAVDSMENASSKVNAGVELSSQAGDALEVIVRHADELQVMVQQIASATEEMSATAEEVSKDIEQIALVSKESSSSSEQTAQAALELSSLSTNLQRSVGEFKL